MLVGWLEIPLTPELIYEMSFTISYVTIPLKRIQISRVRKEILKMEKCRPHYAVYRNEVR